MHRKYSDGPLGVTRSPPLTQARTGHFTESLYQGVGCAIWVSFAHSFFFFFTWGDSVLHLGASVIVRWSSRQWSCFAPTFFFRTSISTEFHNNHSDLSSSQEPDINKHLFSALLMLVLYCLGQFGFCLTADCLGLALASWVGSSCAPVFSQFSLITNYLRLS